MQEDLQRLQLTQLEILKIIDDICRQHGIPYSLYAGSLLGAVRHKAFIPWDDDLDICMNRTDYEQFLKIWDVVRPAGYILQNKDNSPLFTQSFTKIRKDHTTFLQSEDEAGRYHTGIFVDIFPVDRLPEGKRAQTLFRWDCMRYQLLTREFVPPKGNAIVRTASSLILATTPEHKRPAARQRLLAKITRYQHRKDLPLIFIETVASMKKTYPADMMDEFVYLPFEDMEAQCIRQWDLNLRLKFGDYMQLPPEAQRIWVHHPLCIDFERNYEELPSEQGI